MTDAVATNILDANFKRNIYATFAPGQLRIVYQGTISEQASCGHKVAGCLNPWSCMCYGNLSKTIMESTYVQVLENRLEWNYPSSWVTFDIRTPWALNCHVADNVKTVYFDRAIVQNAAVAGMCTPCCTHNLCCPDCCGMCGQTVVLYESSPGMTDCLCCSCCKVFHTSANVGQIPRACCVKSHVILPCIKDAERLVEAINTARNERLASQKIGPCIDMSR